MRIAYITAHTPYGRGETFILEEMLALAQSGTDLIIVPRNPPREVFHDQARDLLGRALWLPLMNRRILFSFSLAAVSNPRLWRILAVIIRQSRSFRILLKNLAVAPKATHVAHLLRRARVEHVHAHWGSTTASMAFIISGLTGIPWSFTLHRWDIAEDNLLRLKAERAAFVRCISEDGRREALRIVGEEYQAKVKVLHMGVRLPEAPGPAPRSPGSAFSIACPANLVPKKGHRYLIEACALLVEWGNVGFECIIIGEGPLEKEIRRQIEQTGVGPFIRLLGRLPHGLLMRMYETGEVDAVVLPSITTEDNEREGIPVALMEAMAYGIPVISTDTGGIPELLSDGCGILVREKDPRQLAEAIRMLMTDQEAAREMGRRGRERVEQEYNLCRNVGLLLSLISGKYPDHGRLQEQGLAVIDPSE